MYSTLCSILDVTLDLVRKLKFLLGMQAVEVCLEWRDHAFLGYSRANVMVFKLSPKMRDIIQEATQIDRRTRMVMRSFVSDQLYLWKEKYSWRVTDNIESVSSLKEIDIRLDPNCPPWRLYILRKRALAVLVVHPVIHSTFEYASRASPPKPFAKPSTRLSILPLTSSPVPIGISPGIVSSPPVGHNFILPHPFSVVDRIRVKCGVHHEDVLFSCVIQSLRRMELSSLRVFNQGEWFLCEQFPIDEVSCLRYTPRRKALRLPVPNVPLGHSVNLKILLRNSSNSLLSHLSVPASSLDLSVDIVLSEEVGVTFIIVSSTISLDFLQRFEKHLIRSLDQIILSLRLHEESASKDDVYTNNVSPVPNICDILCTDV